MKKFISIIALLALSLPLFCRIQNNFFIPGATVAEPSPFFRATSVSEDFHGNVWLGTAGDGLYKFDGTNYVKFLPSGEGDGLFSAHINSIVCDSSGNLWVGTQKGVNRYDSKTHGFIRYKINDWNNYVVSVFEDSFGRIFIITQVGLLELDRENDTFSMVIVFKDQLFIDLYLGDDGAIWVLYRDSIDRYDRNFTLQRSISLPFVSSRAVFDGNDIIYLQTSDSIAEFSTKQEKIVPLAKKLSSVDASEIVRMYRYSDDMIGFIGARHFCYNFVIDRLYEESKPGFPYSIPAKVSGVSRIFKGRNSAVWGVTDNNRVVRLDFDSSNPYVNLCNEFENISVNNIVSDGKFVRFVEQGRYLVTYNLESGQLSKNDIYGIVGLQNKGGFFYLSWNEADDRMFLFSGNVIYEISADSSGEYFLKRRFVKDAAAPFSAVTVDRYGTLWASCRQDPNLYYSSIDETGSYVEMNQLEVDPVSPRLYATKLLNLRNGNVAVGYVDVGLAIIDAFTHNVKFIKLSNIYNQMFVNTLYEDGAGNIWVGTSDAGLFIYNSKTGTVSMPEQFRDRNISSVSSDSEGRTLIVTELTVYMHNSKNDSFTPVWRTGDNRLDQDGRIFTFSDGHSILNVGRELIPFGKDFSQKKDEAMDFGVILTDNKSNVIDFFESDELVGKRGGRVRLDHTRNNLQLALSFPGKTETPFMYRYSVRSVTNGWEEALGRAVIPLYNMPYGMHKVRMNISDEQGHYDDNVEVLSIFIKRPWYISILAMLSYAFVLVYLVSMLIHLAKQRNDKNLEADRIRHEKELQQQLNQENVDFFANISHELRTPLSIISGAANVLSKSQTATVAEQRLHKVITRNSYRMLKLVTQILDFNKLEHNKLKLNVQLQDASVKINEIVEIFAVGAQEKGIQISVKGTEDPMFAWFDIDKFEKILYNLLSNAVKYTPRDGKVTVRAKLTNAPEEFFNCETGLKGNCLAVSVADNGIGIPEDSLKLIFERFGQAKASLKEVGTGIGLYFAKSMVELHHGEIAARNDSGAVFTFALPADKNAYSEGERSASDDIVESVDSHSYLSEYTVKNDAVKAKFDYKVLVIDDDYEIIYFLKSILSTYYTVVTSFDAANGYKMIESESPDIIVSDIMMVEMDGLQLCRMVKENIDMCHIPFILLTAKDTLGNQIEGLNSGADAYIVKPFDPDYLIAMIGTLLRNRENVRHLIGNASKVETKFSDSITPRDKKLLERLYELFEKNLANADINAAQFAEECGISRTKFFYKVKALTGMTPTDYFRVYKLNRSLELLKEDKYKIASVAEMCGFSSPSHFSMLFKKQFGMLPSEYLQNMPLDDDK